MKKVFAPIVIFAATLVLSVALVACVPEGLRTTHDWSDEWSYDASLHWHPCLDDGCKARAEQGYHELEQTAVVTEPGCGTPGVGSFTCPTCGYVTEGEIPPGGEHNWQLTVTENAPTCGADGFGIFECGDCEASKRDIIPATGEHSFATAFTAAEDGLGHYHICSVCGKHDDELPHVDGRVRTTEPKNYRDGRKDTLCADCGAVTHTEPVLNQNVCASFDIEIRLDGGVVPERYAVVEGDDYAVYYPTLNYSDWMTDVRFPGKTVGGTDITVRAYHISNNYNMYLRAYIYNELTGAETLIDYWDYDTKGAAFFNAGILRVNPSRPISIIFKCMIGNSNDTPIEVKCTRKVYFNTPLPEGAELYNAFDAARAVMPVRL